MSQSVESGVIVRHRVSGFSERWTLPEGTVPEARWHYEGAERLRSRAALGLRRAGRSVLVCRNLAIRVREDRPRVGFDPDLCVLEPPPPGADTLESLKLWRADHLAPRLVVELVSKSHPTKDYVEVPDQCATIDVEELVLFDPTHAGPRAHGKRKLLQIWRRAQDGGFERVHAGDSAARSSVLDAWMIPQARDRELLISNDPDGLALWPTAEEAERDAKEAALRRVAELEALVRER